MVHEEILPYFGVNCHFDIEELSRPAPLPSGPIPSPGWAPTAIIQTSQSWRVTFDWETVGTLNNYMSGEWELKIYLEKMGGGEYSLPGNTSIVPFVSAPHHYMNQSITIPANTVPAGVYKVVTAITMKGPSGVPGPIALFGEVPMVQFYDAG